MRTYVVSLVPLLRIPRLCAAESQIVVFIEVLGWAAAVFGSIVATPQVIRLLRKGTTAGVSVIAWQATLGSNIAWTAHGVIGGNPNLWATNAVFGTMTVIVVITLIRDRRLNPFLTIAPSIALGVLVSGVDILLGPVAFAIAALSVSMVTQGAQLQTLFVSPDIAGVSLPFLVMNVINQIGWGSWAVLSHEVSIMICATAIGSIMLVSLIWGLLRRYGVVRARLSVMSA